MLFILPPGSASFLLMFQSAACLQNLAMIYCCFVEVSLNFLLCAQRSSFWAQYNALCSVWPVSNCAIYNTIMPFFCFSEKEELQRERNFDDDQWLLAGIHFLLKRNSANSDALHCHNRCVLFRKSCGGPAAQAGRRSRNPRYEQVLCTVPWYLGFCVVSHKAPYVLPHLAVIWQYS